jgi:hypothetical protein
MDTNKMDSILKLPPIITNIGTLLILLLSYYVYQWYNPVFTIAGFLLLGIFIYEYITEIRKQGLPDKPCQVTYRLDDDRGEYYNLESEVEDTPWKEHTDKGKTMKEIIYDEEHEPVPEHPLFSDRLTMQDYQSLT